MTAKWNFAARNSRLKGFEVFCLPCYLVTSLSLRRRVSRKELVSRYFRSLFSTREVCEGWRKLAERFTARLSVLNTFAAGVSLTHCQSSPIGVTGNERVNNCCGWDMRSGTKTYETLVEVFLDVKIALQALTHIHISIDRITEMELCYCYRSRTGSRGYQFYI